MLKKAMFLIFLTLLTLSVTTKAAIVDYGQYIYDTHTELYWLELTATKNMSYDTVNSRIWNPNDVLYGWTYANGEKFETMIGAYGAEPMCDPEDPMCVVPRYDGWSADNLGVVEKVLDDFGILGGGGSYSYFYSFGILADTNGVGNHRWAQLYAIDDPHPDVGDAIYTHRTAHPGSRTSEDAGSFLIRTDAPPGHPVPLPSTILLLGSGLLGIARLRIKQ